MKAIRSCDNLYSWAQQRNPQSASNGEVFHDSYIGADSGNDDEEEDGGLGRWIGSPSGVHGQTEDRDEAPTVEYFYFSDNQFCLHFRT